MKPSLSILNTNKFQSLVTTFINPAFQSLLSIKMQLGLKLQPEELRSALLSPVQNPIKNWLFDVICSYLKIYFNHQAMILNQLSLTRKKAAEYEAYLIDLDNMQSEEKIKTLFKDLNLQAIEKFLQQLEEKSLSCYQLRQLAKAEEFLFWSSIATNPAQLAKITKAINDRYYWLEKGEKQADIIERKLANNEFSPEEQISKKEYIQAYKDHIILSSTTNAQKFAPDVLEDPDKAVIFVQTAVINEELFVKSFNFLGHNASSDKKTNNTFKNSNAFFNYTSKELRKNEYKDLLFKFDILYNKFFELNTDSSKYDYSELIELQATLRSTQEGLDNTKKEYLFLKINNIIELYKTDHTISEIVNLLQRWKTENISRNNPDFQIAKADNNVIVSSVNSDLKNNSNDKFIKSSGERIGYQLLITFIDEEGNKFNSKGESDHLKKIQDIAEQASKSENEKIYLLNTEIINQFKHLTDEYPLFPLINDLCQLISNLPEIDDSQLVELNDQIDDSFSLGL